MCGFDLRDGCAKRRLFETPGFILMLKMKLLMMAVMMMTMMEKLIMMMVMAPHSQGRRLQDKEERVRRGKNTRE